MKTKIKSGVSLTLKSLKEAAHSLKSVLEAEKESWRCSFHGLGLRLSSTIFSLSRLEEGLTVLR